MELTQVKNLPYFGLSRGIGNFLVPALGIILLAVVAIKFSRGRLALLDVGTITAFVAVIGLAYYKQRRTLSQLTGRLDDEVLSGLCNAATFMAGFGYAMCLSALTPLLSVRIR